ncbi:MAG: SPOR domain-containing protein [Ignavibacteriaceae bacterium]
MKYSKAIRQIIIVLLATFTLGCGSSTGSRYNNEETKGNEHKSEKNLNENFDISKYKTTIDFNDNSTPIANEIISAWYDYPVKIDTNIDQTTIINTANGYRVRVSSTEKLNEADTLRNKLYAKTNQKHIYIIFDPPFYRIEVGDFTEISTARDLKFRLNQLGYNEARVVSERVNVYK